MSSNKLIFSIIIFISAILLIPPISSQNAFADEINLNSWNQEGDLDNGVWTVAPDGSSVFQTKNDPPTMFVSPDSVINASIGGTIIVERTGDNDYIGFVMGFGDDHTGEFILLDWKQAAQSGSPPGFTLARVTGGAQNIPFSNHDESKSGYEVLALNSGNGWLDFTSYDFIIEYNTNRITVKVSGGQFGDDGEIVLDVFGSFSEGRFGFYNHSQEDVRYSGFVDNPEPIIEPTEPISGISCSYDVETSVDLNGGLDYTVGGTETTCTITRGGEVGEPKEVTIVVSKEILGQEKSLFGLAHALPITPSTLYSIDSDTGGAVEIGPVGFNSCSGMETDNLGTVYATCDRPGDDRNVLVTIDTSTGAGTEVGLTNIEVVDTGDFRIISDLSFRNSDGKLFGYAGPEGPLVSINTDTGAATAIGGLQFLSGANSLAFSPSDTLYHQQDNNPPFWFTINPDTGDLIFQGTLIIPDIAGISFGPRINAMDYDNDLDVLFGSLVSGSGGAGKVNHLVTINPITPEVTEVGPTVSGLDAITIAVSTCRSQTGTFTITFDDGSGTIVVNEEGEICQEGSTIEFSGTNTSVDGTGDYEDMGLQCGEVEAELTLNNDSASGTVSITQCEVAAPSSGGGGMNHWDKRPTFGISHETRQDQVVENGFSFNSEYFTLTDNHWTDFEEQSVEIGTINTFSATVYADKKLKVQEFLFGIPNVGEAHLAELGVEIWYDINGEIEDVVIVQNSHVIDADTVSVSHEMTKCLPTDQELKCDTTTVSMKFLEPLQDKVMAIKAIDHERRDQRTFLNDGFDISGESLNPMLTNMIPSSVRYEGLLKVTQVAKYSPYWVAEDDRMFEMNSFGSFKQINQSFERFQDTGEARTRMHSGFGGIIAYEQNRALDIFDGSNLVSELPASFAYIFPESGERITDEMRQAILLQEQIAKEILDEMNKQNRHH